MSPGEHGGNGVGGGFLTLLVLSVMTGDGTVSSFSFNNVVTSNQNTGHQTKRTITLSEAIRLDITIVILASPHETTFRFHTVSDHIVDESVFIPNTSLGEFSLVFLFIDFLEDVLELTVVSLQDGILGRHVKR